MTLKKGEKIYFARLACAVDTVVASVDEYIVVNDFGDHTTTVLAEDSKKAIRHLLKKHCFKTHEGALLNLQTRCDVWIDRWTRARCELH